MPRFFLPQLAPIGQHFELPEKVAHHVLRVLRQQAGETLQGFDGQGQEALLRLTQTTKHNATVCVEQLAYINRESPLRLDLVQGLCAADKMDWVIEKAVELGVQAIHPIQTEKSILRLDAQRAARKLQHWQEIIHSACAQSGRNQLAQLQPIQTWPEWLARQTSATLAHSYIASPRARQRLRDIVISSASTLTLVVGPEGGFSATEEVQALQSGMQALRLGPRILRTETAGLAALAALQAQYGDL